MTENVSLEPSTNNSLYASDVPVEAQNAPLVSEDEPKVTSHESDIRAQIAKEFGAHSDMYNIAQVESGFDEDAKNPNSTAKGVYQILDGSWKSYGCTGNVLNATDNIACARKIYDAEGLIPWRSSEYKWSSL